MRSFLLAAQTRDGRQTVVLNEGKSLLFRVARAALKAAVAAKASPAGPGFPVLLLIEIGKGIAQRHTLKNGVNVGAGTSAPVVVEAEVLPPPPASEAPKAKRVRK